jgi:parallel beta helix pectate lyase-like protein
LHLSNLIFIVTIGASIVFAKDSLILHLPARVHRAYYFSSSGNDNNDGSINHPFQTINKLNSLHLKPGDIIHLKGGETFSGSILIDSTVHGAAASPVIVCSYGDGYAIISSGDSAAITLTRTGYLSVKKLKLVGSGRKNGNTKDGISINYSNHIVVDSLDIVGFQKSGLYIYSSSDITATHVYAHDNGAAGMAVEGPYAKKESCHNIYIGNCIAENNPGDPTNLTNHSGNGIVVADCRKLTIEYCTATNNGWDMPRIGNGPVGIWAYEADSVIIQHCLSYRNKTSVGGADGGGFDLDGGVTNSIVQYCLSYENQGAGFCIFQYLYASPWHDNVFRYNISENDGSVSDARAGIHIWNSSRDSNQFYNVLFYNNTIYNAKGAAISYAELSDRKDFRFFNNIFVGEDSLIKGEKNIDSYLANDWWSLTSQFNIDGMHNFKAWAEKSGKEMIPGKLIGLNINPSFKKPGNTMLSFSSSLKTFDGYKIPSNSLLQKSGLDLHNLYGIKTGNMDFNGQASPIKGIGASF